MSNGSLLAALLPPVGELTVARDLGLMSLFKKQSHFRNQEAEWFLHPKHLGPDTPASQSTPSHARVSGTVGARLAHENENSNSSNLSATAAARATSSHSGDACKRRALNCSNNL